MLATLASAEGQAAAILILFCFGIALLIEFVRWLRRGPPPDRWAAALTQPIEAKSKERVDGTFGAYVGKVFAVIFGLFLAWLLLFWLFPFGLIAVPFLLAWVWPRKRADG